ncbi:MAG: NADPH:quinone oxidoreductase family protein [Deltaproteobacteria bacterium]|nr:MAG: NADPH:quinone oxidoreductase family protein [Deltaproteobacteria bacterium]
MSATFPQHPQLILTSYADDPMSAIEHNIRVQEQARPDPKDLQTTDVVVDIQCVAVGWVDLLMTSGLYQHMPPPPYTPGMEYSGVVSWVGEDVDSSKVKVGDRVAVDGFVVGPRTSGPYRQYGGFATYAVAPSSAVIRIPEDWSFAEGCNFFGSYETAYHCLVANGDLQAGETVLIHGASGATGLAAVHLAKVLGATVIATGRSEDKLQAVKEQGADHVLSLKDESGEGVRRFRDDVKALTDGRGVDVVYDGVGGAISLESLRCVKFGARYLIVGWAATPFVAKGRTQGKAPNPNVLPTNLIMMKGLRVLGCPTIIATQKDPGIRKERLQRLLAWANQGQLRPHVSTEFAMKDYKEAMLHKWNGKVVGGNVVWHPNAEQGDTKRA